MGLGSWLRRVFGASGAGSPADQPAPAPMVRITRTGRLLVAEVPSKPLGDAAGRRALARELAVTVDQADGPVAVDFRVAQVIPHPMREPLIELSDRARRQRALLAFVVRNQDQQEFFRIIQLDRRHQVVFDPAAVVVE